MIEVEVTPGFEGFRSVARTLLGRELAPGHVAWRERFAAQGSLPLAAQPVAGAPATVRVPARFVALAEEASCLRTPAPWTVLYRVLWRLTHGEAHLLDVASDPDVRALDGFVRAVRRDEHRL
ncbi:MAG: uracil-DNA glycosylase, partial [Myxococcales bacterium]